MRRALEFLPEATSEVVAVTKYYEERQSGLGLRFRLELERVCFAITRHPQLWRERSGGYRRVNLRGFPYYVAFFLRQDDIIVSAVAYEGRRPDYWHNRIAQK